MMTPAGFGRQQRPPVIVNSELTSNVDFEAEHMAKGFLERMLGAFSGDKLFGAGEGGALLSLDVLLVGRLPSHDEG